MRWPFALAVSVVLASAAARAEVSLVGLHAQPGVLFDLKNGATLAGGVLKVDTTALGLGPVAIQGQFFAMGGGSVTVLSNGALFGGGLGVRVRLLNDESGYALGTKGVSGSIFSNLWIEAHVNYLHGGFALGADVGVGVELSLYDGLCISPTAKMLFNGIAGPFEPVLMAGLELSFGAPYSPGKETDGDQDGLKGDVDKCPSEAEDKDGFEDHDGCPDGDNDRDEVPDEKDKCKDVAGPTTNDGCPVIPDDDGDRVPNTSDKCRMEKEDQDGFEDTDGCPDPDNDKDGVPDSTDKCSSVAEDKDGFEDEDGCPDLDDDKDGTADDKDKCPTAAGPLDNHGCPVDLDQDKDGVPEPADKCPAEAETVNGVDDADGCAEKDARAWVTDGRIATADRITFTPGAEVLAGKSVAAIDAVAALLGKLPGIKKVRIDAWADETATDDAKAKALGEKRGQAVLKALLARKVAAQRLEVRSQGKAPDANRRLEFAVAEGAAK